jgi:hypothetical protein
VVVIKAHDPKIRGDLTPNHDLLKVEIEPTAIFGSGTTSSRSKDPAISESLAHAEIQSNLGESCS